MSHLRPGESFDFRSRRETKKAEFLIGDPQITFVVLGDRVHRTTGNSIDDDVSVVLEVAELTERRDPDPVTTILIQGLWTVPIERCIACAVGNDAPLIPSVQPIIGREPNSAIASGEHRPHVVVRQTLTRSDRGNANLAKPIEAAVGTDPDIAFAIFEKAIDPSA